MYEKENIKAKSLTPEELKNKKEQNSAQQLESWSWNKKNKKNRI